MYLIPLVLSKIFNSCFSNTTNNNFIAFRFNNITFKYNCISENTTHCGGWTFFSKLFSKVFTKEYFPKEFEKVWKKSLEKKFGKRSGNRSELQRNKFLQPRYVRRFPSFVSARTFADMTTWPYMTMTTLKKKQKRPDILLG
jgi:hypothetical protein